MSELEELRARIDEIDDRWIAALAERFVVTRRVGHLKAGDELAPVDPERESKIDAKARRLAVDQELDPDLVSGILRSIIDRVVMEHRVIAEEATGAGAIDQT